MPGEAVHGAPTGASRSRPLVRRFAAAFGKQRGHRRWDVFIRATGAVALLGIPTVILFPRLVPLVWLAVVAIPANSPLSPITPTVWEPLVMEAAKYESPIWVTLVALTVYLYMEYLNWHLYSWVLNRQVFTRLKEHRWMRNGIALFARAPFTTVAFFAFTPLPFWAIRIVAIFDMYPLRQFMTATAVGRFPRLLAYAWLGAALRIPTSIIIGFIVGTTAIVVVRRLARGERLLADTVLDHGRELVSEEQLELTSTRVPPTAR